MLGLRRLFLYSRAPQQDIDNNRKKKTRKYFNKENTLLCLYINKCLRE